MKIDTSNINLSSEWAFSEKAQNKIEQETKFIDLYNQSLEKFNAKALHGPANAEQIKQWYEATTFGGQDAIELSRQLQNDLEKMYQTLEAISQRLNFTGLKGCCIHLDNLERVTIFINFPLKCWNMSIRKQKHGITRKRRLWVFLSAGLLIQWMADPLISLFK